jgi:Ca2+-binding EF-hand superfamily protein
LFPKIIEIQALMKFYDVDGDSNISYDEFVRGLREPLNDRRKKIVEKAFKQLDRDGAGVITVSDIVNIFNVTKDKDFIDGTKTKQQILEEFLDGFEGARGKKNG